MKNVNSNNRKYIDYFNPDVTRLGDIHQDFLSAVDDFDAGEHFKNFNDFISDDADGYRNDGDGVTYLVWNVFYGQDDIEISRELVAYYTLAATAIPYEDRIRLDEDEAAELGAEFDIQICGISALEIKMFAVDNQYQDIFFCYEGEELPISAWIMRSIIDKANSLIDNVLGFKAVFLHAVPAAENFYLHNGFNYVEKNMHPLHTLDSNYKAMYLSLRPVHMNYDE